MSSGWVPVPVAMTRPSSPEASSACDRRQEFGAETGGHRPGMLFGDVREPEPDVDPLRIQDLVEGGDVVGVHDADPPHADESEDDVLHAAALAGTVNAERKASRAA